jgi:hypothetical protein
MDNPSSGPCRVDCQNGGRSPRPLTFCGSPPPAPLVRPHRRPIRRKCRDGVQIRPTGRARRLPKWRKGAKGANFFLITPWRPSSVGPSFRFPGGCRVASLPSAVLETLPCFERNRVITLWPGPFRFGPSALLWPQPSGLLPSPVLCLGMPTPTPPTGGPRGGPPDSVQVAAACPSCGRKSAIVFPVLHTGDGDPPKTPRLACLRCCPKPADETRPG